MFLDMKIMISHFYNIRFFERNMIPFSTAVSGPQWYHDFKGPKHIFIDKRGVVNGLVAYPLVPDSSCDGLCAGKCDPRDPKHCAYLKAYKSQLWCRSFNDTLRMLEIEAEKANLTDEDPIAVLMVYEKPDNLCSEREPLKEWFAEHDYPLEEFVRPGAEKKPRKLF